jgi:hypothetical protein
MDQQIRTRLQALSDRIIDVRDLVKELAGDPHRNPHQVRECQEAIQQVQQEYDTLLSEVAEEDRSKVERRYGRKVIDLRREAAFMPELTDGHAVVQVHKGDWPFQHSGSASINSPPPRQIGERVDNGGGPRVGGDVESWCGACDGLTSHVIVAMVDGKPKQVTCNACGARHLYRLTPARSRGGAAAPGTPRQRAKPTKEAAQAKRMRETRQAFQNELAAATEFLPFNPRARYKAGQFIDHPQHGRGKIENVTRGSLLVRFLSGLKPVNRF